jgi:hypothetical protein
VGVQPVRPNNTQHEDWFHAFETFFEKSFGVTSGAGNARRRG